MQEAKRALTAWDISVDSIRTDEVPEVYHVESAMGDRFVLKNVGEPDVLVRTETQYRVTRHIHECGFPIAYLVETKAGSFYGRVDSSIYILMPYLPDDGPDFYSADAAPLYRTIGVAYGEDRTKRPL